MRISSELRHGTSARKMFKFIGLPFISLLLALSPSVRVEPASRRVERSVNRSFRSVLKVDNGMRWGSWGQKQMCPAGMFAAGFSLKVEYLEKSILHGDATALNGIRLHCINPSKGSSGPYEDYATVQSDSGCWGKWSDIKWCSSGFLKSFQLRVEPYQGSWDDTAANNIRFSCSGTGEVLEGSGTSWGVWSDWSDVCEGKGIGGIETMVLEPQGSLDDTALNDARMFCCD